MLSWPASCTTSLIVCALGIHVRNIKQRKHAVWVQDYLTKTVFDTFNTTRLVSHDESSLAKMHYLDGLLFHVNPSGIWACTHFYCGSATQTETRFSKRLKFSSFLCSLCALYIQDWEYC